ncbi:MAG: TrkH family potassium uptake protein [Clostridia bacterium]|nr:TrkH family potassium uptake protein [Clostridia bacterium]
MLVPAAVSAYYGEWDIVKAFLLSCIPVIVAGSAVTKYSPKPKDSVLRMRDGFFVVGVSWLAMSFVGCLPFMISGTIPAFADAYFETASGFSTTGSTILSEIQSLPKGILFWRSFTHWLGGMGVLVLTIAILPKLGIGGQKIMRAETTGPTMDKISFTTNETAKILYMLYCGLSVIEMVFLLAGGMSLYDALVNTFGTVGTGGFSNYNASIGAYDSVYFEMVISVFMLLAGVNFSLYYNIVRKKPLNILKDYEFRVYAAIVGASTAFITAMLVIKNNYETIGQAFRYAFFQVSSIITTTGYGTADFDTWPLPCRFIIFFLMFVGGCAGSTGGGMKVIRVAFTAKLINRGISRRLHPQSVSPIKVAGKTVSAETMSGVAGFVLLYIFTIVIGTLLIALEGVTPITALSSVVACVSNIGPGFEAVGPTMNFGFYSAPAKLLLSMFMIAGRLELFTIILLFTPAFWNRRT